MSTTKEMCEMRYTWTNVETANTFRVFFRMATARMETLKPMAQEVYPFKRIISYALHQSKTLH